MSELTIINESTVPAYLQAEQANELALNEKAASGVSIASFLPALSFKGKAWSVRMNGQTTPFNKMEVDVVIIAARERPSKVLFQKTYNPKEITRPDCGSCNGITADFDSEVKDPETGAKCSKCAECFYNRFGTATQGGGKACKDYKRLVVMLASQDGKTFPSNAPALTLDIPGTSFRSPKGENHMMLSEMLSSLQQAKVPLSQYVVTLGFVVGSEYPQITFRPKRFVMAEEYSRVKSLRESDMVQNSLTEKYTKAEETEDSVKPAATVQPVKKVPVKEPVKESVKPMPEPISEPSNPTEEEDVMAAVEQALAQFQ